MTSQSMFREGDPSAKILFLAQAPSYMEKRLGKPLVGPSGDVFNTCLHAAGLPRRGSYILNLWREEVKRVQRGTREEYWSEDGSTKLWDGARLTEAGLALGKDTLEDIRNSNANLVVALGAQALEATCGPAKRIGKWRGSIIKGVDAIGGKKVIPTYHPAATLHGTYLWRYVIISDFKKAARHKEFPALNLPQRNHIIRPRLNEIIEFLHMCKKKGIMATDLEVINHQIACFSLCCHPNETMTVPLTNQDGSDYWSIDEEIDIWTEYAKIMNDPDVDKVNQNLIGFDSPFLFYQMGIFTAGKLLDTMIAQSVMYPEFPKGLDFITSLYTDEPYYKDEGKMWKGLGGSIEEFWVYCGKDSAVALESWNVLAQDMDDEGYWPTYNMTARLANPLTYMTTRGFKVDIEAMKKTHNDVDIKLRGLYQELKETAEIDFNPLSPKQCQNYFYNLKGLKPYIGPRGNITTDDKAMARIFRRDGLREAKLVQEIRAMEKLKSTYLEINFDGDGRLRCSWNPRGTKFGRLSSSQTVYGTGANMQNLHPEFVSFLVADKEPL